MSQPLAGRSVELSASQIKIACLVPFSLFAVVILFSNLGIRSDLDSLIWLIPGKDKTIHFLAFGTLSLPASYLFGYSIHRLKLRSLLASVSTMLLLATAEEFSQIFLDTRTFDWFDLLSNYSGITFFSLVAGFIAWLNSKR